MIIMRMRNTRIFLVDKKQNSAERGSNDEVTSNSYDERPFESDENESVDEGLSDEQNTCLSDVVLTHFIDNRF